MGYRETSSSPVLEGSSSESAEVTGLEGCVKMKKLGLKCDTILTHWAPVLGQVVSDSQCKQLMEK